MIGHDREMLVLQCRLQDGGIAARVTMFVKYNLSMLAKWQLPSTGIPTSVHLHREPLIYISTTPQLFGAWARSGEI